MDGWANLRQFCLAGHPSQAKLTSLRYQWLVWPDLYKSHSKYKCDIQPFAPLSAVLCVPLTCTKLFFSSIHWILGSSKFLTHTWIHTCWTLIYREPGVFLFAFLYHQNIRRRDYLNFPSICFPYPNSQPFNISLPSIYLFIDCLYPGKLNLFLTLISQSSISIIHASRSSYPIASYLFIHLFITSIMDLWRTASATVIGHKL